VSYVPRWSQAQALTTVASSPVAPYQGRVHEPTHRSPTSVLSCRVVASPGGGGGLAY
jgi:hypothetical protein